MLSLPVTEGVVEGKRGADGADGHCHCHRQYLSQFLRWDLCSCLVIVIIVVKLLICLFLVQFLIVAPLLVRWLNLAGLFGTGCARVLASLGGFGIGIRVGGGSEPWVLDGEPMRVVGEGDRLSLVVIFAQSKDRIFGLDLEIVFKLTYWRYQHPWGSHGPMLVA